MKKIFAISLISLISSLLLPLSAQTSHAFTLSDVGSQSLKDVARCAESKDQLNVLYLMDASISLKKSDPNGERAKILSQSIAGLVAISQFKDVNFSLTTFGDKFTTRRDWKKIDSSSASVEQNWVEKNVPSLNTESGTNWLKGLQESKDAIENSPNAKNSCKLLIWITDGGIDLDSKAKDTEAIQRICGINPKTGLGDPKNSLIDEIRSNGIFLLGVLLNNPNAIATSDQSKQRSKMSFMQSIAESAGTVDSSWFDGPSSQNFNCGTSPVPASYASGAFFEAKEPIEVLRAMMQITTSLKGCASWGQSEDGTFQIDKSVAGVEVSLVSERWQLISPSNQSVADEGSKSERQAGLSVETIGLFSNLTIEKPLLTEGQWRIENNPSLPIEPFYCHGLRINLNTISLVAGEEAQITGKISRKDGSKFDLRNYGGHKLSVTALDPKSKLGTPLKMQILTNGVFDGKFTPQFESDIVAFDISLNVSSINGKQFLPLVQRFEIKIREVSNYPHFEPAKLIMPEIRGRDSNSKSEITIVSAKEDGEICFKKPIVEQVPEGVLATDYSVTGDAVGCIKVPANSPPIKLPFVIKNTKAIDGDVEVLLPATLKIVSDSEGIPQSLSATANSVRGSKAPIWLVLLLFIISLAFPLGLLTLLNSRAARLSTRGLRVASVDVQIRPNGNGVSITRTSAFDAISSSSFGNQLFEINDWDLLPFATNGARQWVAPNGAKLVAKRPSNPFGVVEAFVFPPAGSRIITGIETNESSKFAPISLNPANQWILQIPSTPVVQGDPVLQGKLVAFLDSTADLQTDAIKLSSEVSASPNVQRLSSIFTNASNSGSSSIQSHEFFNMPTSTPPTFNVTPSAPSDPGQQQIQPNQVKPNNDDPFNGL